MNTASQKRLRLLLVGLVVALAFGLIVSKRLIKRPLGNGLSTSGGTAMDTRITAQLFKQWDPLWRNQPLGSTDSPMGSAGCTVCSLAMALSSRGFQYDPGSLNAQLALQQAFTPTGLLIWSGVSAVTNGSVRVHLDDRPSFGAIDSQLTAGNPVQAKVLYDNRVWHWVLITGKSSTDYLIHDPLSKGSQFEPMSEYPRGIYAIRYLEKP